MDRYYLEFVLIPQLVNYYREGILSFEDMVNEDSIGMLSDVDEEDDEDTDEKEFQQEVIRDGENALIVYTFPKPKREPHAKYGAIIVRDDVKEAQYFTLEAAQPDYWMLCSMRYDEGSIEHQNYDTFKGEVTLESFIEEVKNRFKLK
jgi:hypothetical protein